MLTKADDEQKLKRLSEALVSFKCSKDHDIETFLHTKAIEFIKRNLCSVYLILNEELFLENKLKIEAYFTLSHKVLAVTENISKSKVKDVNGFKNLSTLHFVLIGQLGKHIEQISDSKIECSEISSTEILDLAFEVIYASNELIPIKCVLVECSDEIKVRNIYENYGFKFFQHDGEHNQYYKSLD